MSMATIGAILTLIVFVAVLATPKLQNWFCFLIMAPIVVFTGTMDADGVYAVLSSSSFHLMAIICMFSGMIAATGLDIVMGNALDKLTGNVSGKKKEMLIFAILYLASGLVSFVLQNSYVAMAFLPVIFSIAKKNKISHSKMILFVIYASTLGGACTLIGTPTNIYANTALEEAGLKLFGMFDFAWVGIPIFILGGIYMIVMNRWCPSYEETVPSNSEIEAATEITPEMKKKKMVVGISFLLFVLALILDSLTDITVNPNFIGYALIAVSVLTTVVKPKEVITSFGVDMVLFCAGINLIHYSYEEQWTWGSVWSCCAEYSWRYEKSVSDHSSIVPWIGNCNTVYEQYGNRRSTCPDWDLYCRINGSKPTGNCSCNCNWSRMLFPDTDRIRNKSDINDIYKLKIY